MLKKIIAKLKLGSCDTKLVDKVKTIEESEKKKLENGEE
jgi:hypothetical protein